MPANPSSNTSENNTTAPKADLGSGGKLAALAQTQFDNGTIAMPDIDEDQTTVSEMSAKAFSDMNEKSTTTSPKQDSENFESAIDNVESTEESGGRTGAHEGRSADEMEAANAMLLLYHEPKIPDGGMQAFEASFRKGQAAVEHGVGRDKEHGS